MSIERSIHASLPLGIEKSESGFQYFSYTPGFRKLLESDTSRKIEGIASAGYIAPDADEWLLELPEGVPVDQLDQSAYRPVIPDNTADCNNSELIAKKYHPYSFSHRIVEVAGVRKHVFLFGKNMGFDWTGRRPGNFYHYTVVCETQDIIKAPAFYCSSPAVCCNIMRSEFFPETGAIGQPSALSYISSLDSEGDIAPLNYSAGFDEITPDDIAAFIAEDDRVEILLSMLTALMEYKDGNMQRRIIIADEKSNVMLWIAALSYIFPSENVLDLSFSSYTHTPSDLDINGVFVPSLNNCFSRSRSGYKYDVACNSYAVFDFGLDRFAPEVTVDDSVFMDAVSNAFAMNLRIIDTYKDYIIQHTTYRGMGREYADGYDLFAFMSGKKVKLDLAKAVKFAKKYGTAAEKKALLKKLMEDYVSLSADDAKFRLLQDYIAYCCNEGIADRKEVHSFFIMQFRAALFDNAVEHDVFKRINNLCASLCGISEQKVSILLVNSIPADELMEFVKTTRDSWRISYVVYAICCAAEEKQLSIRSGTTENSILAAAFARMTTDDTVGETTSLNTFIRTNFKTLRSVENRVHFCDVAYFVFEHKGYVNCNAVVINAVVDIYMSGNSADRNNLMAVLEANKTSDRYLACMIRTIGREQDVYRLISAYQDLVDYGRSMLRPFIADIISTVKNARNDLIGVSPDKRMEICFAVYNFLRMCAERMGIAIPLDELDDLYNSYLSDLIAVSPDFSAKTKHINEMMALHAAVKKLGGDPQTETVNMYNSIAVMKLDLDNTDDTSCFMGNTRAYDRVSPCELPDAVAEKYLMAVGALCGEFWVNNELMPQFQKMVRISDKSKTRGIHMSIFTAMADHTLRNLRHGTSRCAADVVEYAIANGYETLLDNITVLFDEWGIKKNVLDHLDKDIKTKVELKKIKPGSLLESVDVKKLQQRTDEIRRFYEENSKGILDNIKGIFAKKK